MATSEPDYIVIRRGPTLPESFHLPAGWVGRWFDRAAHTLPPTFWFGTALAVPTGRFEIRDDLAVAEVYEVSPVL